MSNKRDKKTVKYSTVSLPSAIITEIDNLIELLGFWPSRSSFVREACLEKIFKEKEKAEGLARV